MGRLQVGRGLGVCREARARRAPLPTGVHLHVAAACSSLAAVHGSHRGLNHASLQCPRLFRQSAGHGLGRRVDSKAGCCFCCCRRHAWNSLAMGSCNRRARQPVGVAGCRETRRGGGRPARHPGADGRASACAASGNSSGPSDATSGARWATSGARSFFCRFTGRGPERGGRRGGQGRMGRKRTRKILGENRGRGAPMGLARQS